MHFPLNNAYICQNCECIGDNAKHCEACASVFVHRLDLWLNRSAQVITVMNGAVHIGSEPELRIREYTYEP